MTALKNGKWEKFAQGLAKGKTADEAYEAAGYKPNRGNAARLKANESILKRVAEIQERVSEKAEWSAADRLEALKRITERAEETDPRVAVSAIAEANKMQGSHAPAKQETGEPGTWRQSEDRTWREVLRDEKS
ncbi:hypothetical protein KUV46_15750 [Thalassovita mediterranea]|nr:hypothetical protein KUV46_15750 [Thalassovita mediterranea]